MFVFFVFVVVVVVVLFLLIQYWWVALIILGVLAIFVPIWLTQVPEGLTKEERDRMLAERNTIKRTEASNFPSFFFLPASHVACSSSDECLSVWGPCDLKTVLMMVFLVVTVVAAK